MKTNSKILVIAIVAIILMSVFSFVNASSAKEDLKNFLKGTYTICGQNYSFTADQLKVINDYLDRTNFPEENYRNSLQNLKDALYNLTYTNSSAINKIPENDRIMAVSFVQSATLHMGVELHVDLNSNQIKAIEKESGNVLLNTGYSIDASGKVVVGIQSSTGAPEVKKFHQDSSSALVFRFLVDYSNFQNGGKVYVDDKEISSSNYISKSGSTIIELKPEYLKTLGVGAHTITVAFTNGQKLSEGFEVLAGANNGGAGAAAPASSGNSATTGKAFAYTGNDSIAYILLSLLAVATVSTTFVKKVNKK